ncbi:MAG TPA: hypothetical protein VGV67_15155 [Solirubrobacteraceae bacterium]|nr:hypothetical protein [Solirubrobacteraceae bacterium]
MSARAHPRASDLAAQQVEQIVSAAQAAAEEIRREARLEQEDLRRWAQEDGDDLREKARREAERVLEQARKQALQLGVDAHREAEALLEDAREESARTREQTQRAVDGRVAAAEQAAADVLEEARALSGGLRQLGKSLEDHAEGILRDVTAAHKRMRADLRVGGPAAGEPAKEIPSEAAAPVGPRSAPARKALATSRANEARPADGDGASGERPRRNPMDDLEVPSWVGHR